MDVGKSIKIGLIKRDMQQKDLAEALMYKPAHLSNLANGKSTSMKSVSKIAAALDYTVSEFIALGE